MLIGHIKAGYSLSQRDRLPLRLQDMKPDSKPKPVNKIADLTKASGSALRASRNGAA